MDDAGNSNSAWPRTAVVFGSSGGIGSALCHTLAQRGCDTIHAGSRSAVEPVGPRFRPFAFNLEDESSIQSAAEAVKDTPPDLVIIATGVLTLPDGAGPERTFKRVGAAAMAKMFAINTIGPALIAKHFLPLLPRDARCVFAALSARVGSISDNGLGGWHSYRASKAALNMLIRNFALEMARSHDLSVIVGLHPGTVASALSEPFWANLPEGQLTQPDEAAANLLDVLASLRPEHSGKVFDFNGEEVPT